MSRYSTNSIQDERTSTHIIDTSLIEGIPLTYGFNKEVMVGKCVNMHHTVERIVCTQCLRIHYGNY